MRHRFGPPPWIHGHLHPWGPGFSQSPGTLLPVLSTIFWAVLFITIAWLLLMWLIPYMRPAIPGSFGRPLADLSPLDLLRQRYAAGEIDAQTFAQMRKRLAASYQPKDIRPGEDSHQRETRTHYRETFPSPGPYVQGKAMMMEQEQYSSDGE